MALTLQEFLVAVWKGSASMHSLVSTSKQDTVMYNQDASATLGVAMTDIVSVISVLLSIASHRLKACCSSCLYSNCSLICLPDHTMSQCAAGSATGADVIRRG